MKLFISLFLIVFISGCTSLKPIEMQPLELQQRIISDNIIKIGDEIKLITADNEEYEFEVTEVTGKQIIGADIKIPIENVVALETREFSGGKTILLTGTLSVLTYMAIVFSSLTFLAL